MTKRRSGYYVTAMIVRHTSYLAGPFDTWIAAHKMVPAIKHAALRHDDPRLQFAAYGVTKMTAATLPPGRLDIATLIDDAYVALVIKPYRE